MFDRAAFEASDGLQPLRRDAMRRPEKEPAFDMVAL
jgi:hypothetical protein